MAVAGTDVLDLDWSDLKPEVLKEVVEWFGGEENMSQGPMLSLDPADFDDEEAEDEEE